MNKRVNPISSSSQIDLGFEGISEQMPKKRPADPGYREIHEKYNPPEKSVKGPENEYFKDQRTPRSPLVAEAEITKMKEILNKPKGGGSTSTGGGGGGMGTGKMNRDITKNYKAGGKVSSASKRADGIAIRGKTRA
jgi:hypothetical protein